MARSTEQRATRVLRPKPDIKVIRANDTPISVRKYRPRHEWIEEDVDTTERRWPCGEGQASSPCVHVEFQRECLSVWVRIFLR